MKLDRSYRIILSIIIRSERLSCISSIPNPHISSSSPIYFIFSSECLAILLLFMHILADPLLLYYVIISDSQSARQPIISINPWSIYNPLILSIRSFLSKLFLRYKVIISFLWIPGNKSIDLLTRNSLLTDRYIRSFFPSNLLPFIRKHLFHK